MPTVTPGNQVSANSLIVYHYSVYIRNGSDITEYLCSGVVELPDPVFAMIEGLKVLANRFDVPVPALVQEGIDNKAMMCLARMTH